MSSPNPPHYDDFVLENESSIVGSTPVFGSSGDIYPLEEAIDGTYSMSLASEIDFPPVFVQSSPPSLSNNRRPKRSKRRKSKKPSPYYSFFLVTFPMFCGYAVLFSLQKKLKNVFGIPDDNSFASHSFGVGISCLYIGNLIFRMGHNIFFFYLSPWTRVLLAICSMFISQLLVSLMFLKVLSCTIFFVYVAYIFGGLGIGCFEANVLAVATPLEGSKFYAILAIPVGINTITIGGFLLLDVGVLPFYVVLSITTLTLIAGVVFVVRIPRKSQSSSTSSSAAAASLSDIPVNSRPQNVEMEEDVDEFFVNHEFDSSLPVDYEEEVTDDNAFGAVESLNSTIFPLDSSTPAPPQRTVETAPQAAPTRNSSNSFDDGEDAVGLMGFIRAWKWSNFRQWGLRVWLHAICMMINMFCVSLFSPGVVLYLFPAPDRVQFKIWHSLSVKNSLYIALYDFCFFLGDFFGRKIFYSSRMMFPLVFSVFNVVGLCFGFSTVPDITFVAAFLIALGNGGLYAQSCRHIDNKIPKRFNLVSLSTWLFVGDFGSVIGSNLISFIVLLLK